MRQEDSFWVGWSRAAGGYVMLLGTAYNLKPMSRLFLELSI